MNVHARKIWQAWIDGKTVQILAPMLGTESTVKNEDVENGSRWIECDPNKVDESKQPHIQPNVWRIKPQYRTIRFKVALCDGPHDTLLPLIIYPCDYKETENKPLFIKWIGDEVLVERSVEE